ncbi:MAG: DegV family protein, partial [Chloroflexi bacterium]|nr:DegV family protein [Chloroflexota bacterium]
MPVFIVTDSTSDIPRDLADQYGITVVPLSITFGDESFRDGVDMGADEFYARLQSAKHLPTTSQPPPALFQHAYRHLISRGDVVSIPLSHKFSGTVETARAAARDVAPDKITVVDSGFASMALGLVVLAAARAAQAGATRAECAAVAESAATRIKLLVTFETLDYLRRGGRIGRASAFLGGLLKLKPVLTVKDGEAHPVARMRSRQKALDELLALALSAERLDEVAVLQSTTPQDADDLAARVSES